MVVFQGGRDLFGLLQRGGQWLVAVDVLPVGDGGEDGRAMLVVGGADIDDVDVRILRDVTEIGGGLDAVADFVDFGFVARQVKEKRDVQMSVGVDFADESTADEADAVSFHSCSDCSVFI